MNMHPALNASAQRFVVLGFLAIGIFIFGFGIWSTTAQITGAIITPGKVEVDSNRQIVQHPVGGVVAGILVDDGDLVAADDILVRLDTASLRAELAFAREQLFDLQARQERLHAETLGAQRFSPSEKLRSQSSGDPALALLLDGQRNMFDAYLTNLTHQTTQLRQQQGQMTAQIEGISAQLQALEIQITLNENALGNQQDLLARGLSQAADVLSLQREKAVLEGRSGELRAKRAQVREHIAETEIAIVQLDANRRGQATSTLRDLDEQLRQMRHEVSQLEAEIAASDIRAPSSGIVYGMAVQTRRAVVRPAEPLMYLIPQDRPRVIAANVPTQHIDRVRVGQPVKMRLSALNARTTPEVFGQITLVSADAIQDELRGGFYYRIEVELDAGELAKLPKDAVLLPGMPVETFIQTGDRSPMAYLVKPFSDYLARAFREG